MDGHLHSLSGKTTMRKSHEMLGRHSVKVISGSNSPSQCLVRKLQGDGLLLFAPTTQSRRLTSSKLSH